MMAENLYSPGDVVYLKESAAIGKIEAVRINQVVLNNDGWVYSIKDNSSIGAPGSYSERRSLVSTQVPYFSEDEFVTVCEAYLLAETSVKALYDKIRAQRIALCGDVTES